MISLKNKEIFMNNVIKLPTQPTESKTKKAVELVKDIFGCIFIPDSSDDALTHYFNLIGIICALAFSASVIYLLAHILLSNKEITSQQPAGRLINITPIEEGVKVDTTKGIYFTEELFNLSIDTEMLLVKKEITPLSLCNKSLTQCSALKFKK